MRQPARPDQIGTGCIGDASQGSGLTDGVVVAAASLIGCVSCLTGSSCGLLFDEF